MISFAKNLVEHPLVVVFSIFDGELYLMSIRTREVRIRLFDFTVVFLAVRLHVQFRSRQGPNVQGSAHRVETFFGNIYQVVEFILNLELDVELILMFYYRRAFGASFRFCESLFRRTFRKFTTGKKTVSGKAVPFTRTI